ncbi:MAG: cytochrome c oxidase assembly protein [Actinomycetes bacterium]
MSHPSHPQEQAIAALRPHGLADVVVFALALLWIATIPSQVHNLPINFLAQLALTMGIVPLYIVVQARRSKALSQPPFIASEQLFVNRAIPRWIAFVSVLLLLHSPVGADTVHRLGLVGQCVSAIIQVWAGFIYFAPILGTAQQTRTMTHAHRVFSLFAMMVPETMIGFFIYIQKEPIYSQFLAGQSQQQALHQQQLAGALMWALAMVVDAVWLAIAVQKWFTNEERRGEEFNAAWKAEQENSL